MTGTGTDQERWGRVKERLRAEVGDDIFQSWFARMDLERIENGAAFLSVPTRFLKSWIASHYTDRVVACWQAEHAEVQKIEVSVRSAVIPHRAAEGEAARGDGRARTARPHGPRRSARAIRARLHRT